MSESNNDLLLWLDAETTGLNPWVGGNKLLQIAAIVTDTDLNELSEPFMRIIHYPEAEAVRLRDEVANDFVRNMHQATGLWDLLPTGTPVEQVDEELLAFIQTYAPGVREARLAGNSVRLDLNFGDFFLPKSMGHLHYRSVDVSAIGFILDSWRITEGECQKAKTHEALSDIRESLAELRWMRSFLQPGHTS